MDSDSGSRSGDGDGGDERLERESEPIHEGAKRVLGWADRTPFVEVVPSQDGFSLRFEGEPRSTGWVVVTHGEEEGGGSFVMNFDRLKQFQPFMGKGRKRLLNTFERTPFYQRGRNGVPHWTLDDIRSPAVWKFIEGSSLNLIADEVRRSRKG